jgi:hypothetical protein
MPNNIPRVTEVIAAMFPERWKPDPWYLTRGTFVHRACELADMGELDPESIDPAIQTRVDAYWRFRNESEFQPEIIEKRFTHSRYQYTGQIDRAGELNGKKILLDIKSGVESVTDNLQGGAYWGLLEDAKIQVFRVHVLYLKEDGSYRLTEVENIRKMFNVFLAALTLFNFKEGR